MEAAIKKCINNSNYRVLIVTNKKEIIRFVVWDIKRICDKCKIYYSNFHNYRMWLQNGSIIRLISENSCLRGYKAHLILFDEDLDIKYVDAVLKPLVQTYIMR